MGHMSTKLSGQGRQ
ncbi:hypothetical protein CAEBREN_10040 [Caenorhabditis brenneri]|uniref:Uncharacterized protein n=1 Tax=Caenorhabditis brenneri TaxID=135651 RepID=G0N287_CAEBE|nr:hypothetical protein CAEBREN_10040 [Caenorhabditis brenneri]